MPQIDLPVDFYKLHQLSKAHQTVVADFFMMRKDLGAFEAGFIYYFNQMPNTYAIRFKQDVELVASVKHPGRYHCFIADETLGEGTIAMVRKSALKVTLLPEQDNYGHFQFAEPKSQSRAIKYANLESYGGSKKEASNAVVAEAEHLSMVVPARLHHRIPVGGSHSDIFLPRIIMPCYPGENLLALSNRKNLSPELYSLKTKCELTISMLAKLMFLQQWLIHLDLKPLNMMVDMANRDVNFVDFAFAMEIKKLVIIEDGGSPYYNAPERFSALNYKHPKALDTFSVGVVIAEMFVTDEKLQDNVVSYFLNAVCVDLHRNWDSSDEPYISSPCKKRFKQRPDYGDLFFYVRKYLLTAFDTDVFMWNSVGADFPKRLSSVVGDVVFKVLARLQMRILEKYSIPYKDLDNEQCHALTKIIMNILATNPSERATASEALNDFIQYYLKKYPDDIETLKYRIQKQLLMAAVDAAIQKLKNEVYKIPFDEMPIEEKSKIACLREILEKLKQFRKQCRKNISDQASTNSSGKPPVPATSIAILRQKVSECFPSDKNVIATLSRHRSLHGKAINEASRLIGCFFSPSSNPLASAQSGLYFSERFHVAEQALQIIEDANCMADNIFANELAPRPQSSQR